jgi:hypothetical protein
MFGLVSDITIGKFKRVKPIEVKITKSIYEFVEKTVIKLPITARIVRAGEVITASVEVAKQFTEADKVNIKLGYNNVLKNEFDGFVSRINFTSPLDIECEGYSYQLRKKTYQKTFINTQLIEILKYLVAGTDIVLDTKNIPQFKIDKMVLQKHSGVEALEIIKKISNNTIKIFFTGNLLYAGLQYLNTKADVKYRLGWNVIKDGNLKLRQAKNQDVTVNYIAEKKDGTKVKVTAHGKTRTKANVITTSANSGTTGEEKVIKTHAVTDESTLKAMADATHASLSFDGYEGKITAFGVPYCETGYRAIVEDKKYEERSGNYIVESTEVTYGRSGFRRIVGIGAKL